MDTTDLGDTGASSRRRFLRAGLSGAALSATLPLLARTAAAQETGAPATTTTAPPRRPTDGDVTLLTFAESVELTARDLYAAAVASGVLSDDERSVLETIGGHHAAYAQVLSGLLGPAASRSRIDDLFDELEPAFTSSSSVLEAAHALEDTAVATHTELLAGLEGTEGAARIASILVVEAQHAVVLAQMADIDDLDTLLTTQAAALTPSGADESE